MQISHRSIYTNILILHTVSLTDLIGLIKIVNIKIIVIMNNNLVYEKKYSLQRANFSAKSHIKNCHNEIN